MKGKGKRSAISRQLSQSLQRLIVWVLLVRLFLLLLLPLSPVIVPARALAAPGDLVPSFGTGGVVMTDFAEGNDSAQAVTTTRLGKIIAVGSATIPGQGTDFALACHNENGILDSTFGTGGKVTIDFFGANDGARDVVVQPNDQKIILSGFATNGSERQFAFARFNPDGSLDPTFGQGGKVVLDLGATSEAFKVALQPDLKIVAVGDSRPQNSLDFTIVRLNPDGSLDNTFGTNGVVTVDLGNTDRAIDLAIDQNNIFVAGIVVKSQTDSDFGIVRLNITDGSLNLAFDGDGKLTVDFFGKQDGAQAITIRQPIAPVNEPHLLVGGFATNTTAEDFALFSVDFIGRPTSSPFNQGKATVDFSGTRDLLVHVFNQPDGAFVGVGWAGDGVNFDLGIVKWNADGALDSDFGLQGKYTLDTASGANNVAFDGVIYKDTIITAGTGLNPTTGNDDFVITQHENKKYAEIIKRAPAVPVVKGDTITYSFEINNLTDNELSLVVTDVLPVGVTFEESQNSDWRILSEFGRSPIIARRLSVPGGQTSFIGLRVRADQSGILENKANLLLPYPNDPIIGYITPSLLGSSRVESEVKEPEITNVTQQGKKLTVTGTNLFGTPASTTSQARAIEASAIESRAQCPIILVDGQEKKTKPDPQNPTTVLIAKKGGKKIARGQTVRVRVRLCNGIETEDFLYTRPR